MNDLTRHKKEIHEPLRNLLLNKEYGEEMYKSYPKENPTDKRVVH